VNMNVNVTGLPTGLPGGLPHQRLIPLAYDRSDDIIEIEHFPAKRSRHTLSHQTGNGGDGQNMDLQGI
jgi:hypothetical protein